MGLLSARRTERTVLPVPASIEMRYEGSAQMKKHALLGLRGLFLVGLIAAGIAMLPSPMTTSSATERQTVSQGLTACYAWCHAHRTGNQLSACTRGCDRYWFCNGRDANTQSHRDVCAIA